MSSFKCLVKLFSILVIFPACHPPHDTKTVEAAMQRYNRLIKKMDADSIAMMYTEDGDMGTMAHGRDSIRKLLSSFGDLKVLSQSSESSSITINADSAVQQGSFHQEVLRPGNDTLRINGSFITHWQWVSPQGWLIRKSETDTRH